MNIQAFVNIEKVLNDFGEKLTKLLEAGLPEQKNATGTLRNSIAFSVTLYGTRYNFQLTLADYYKFVDEGRKPGSKPPPISAILQWIKDKRLIITKGKLQVRSPKNIKVDLLANGARSLSMAFAISKNIAKNGIRPMPFFTNATRPEIFDQLAEDLKAAAGRDIIIEIKNRLNA